MGAIVLTIFFCQSNSGNPLAGSTHVDPYDAASNPSKLADQGSARSHPLHHSSESRGPASIKELDRQLVPSRNDMPKKSIHIRGTHGEFNLKATINPHDSVSFRLTSLLRYTTTKFEKSKPNQNERFLIMWWIWQCVTRCQDSFHLSLCCLRCSLRECKYPHPRRSRKTPKISPVHQSAAEIQQLSPLMGEIQNF